MGRLLRRLQSEWPRATYIFAWGHLFWICYSNDFHMLWSCFRYVLEKRLTCLGRVWSKLWICFRHVGLMCWACFLVRLVNSPGWVAWLWFYSKSNSCFEGLWGSPRKLLCVTFGPLSYHIWTIVGSTSDQVWTKLGLWWAHVYTMVGLFSDHA